MVRDEQAPVGGPITPDDPDVAAVHEALAGLDELDRLPLLEHAQVFEDVHAALGRLLAEPER